MSKLNQQDYSSYWRAVHRSSADDLAPVCFPDKPPYFNRFFDRSQKSALGRYLRHANLDLSGKRLLDVGCGRGRWLRYFAERGATTTGIDFAQDAVESCTAQHLDARRASVTELPFEDGVFDVVSSITVLLHLPYDMKEQAVAEIARVLRPDGRALLIESTWKSDPSAHVYGVALEDWQRLFAARGLKLRYRAGHYFNLFRRALPGRLPARDFIAIHLDYPLELLLMRLNHRRESSLGLQHVMEFVKEDA